MIDLISSLVRYIVILLFLTVLLEMILPQGTFRRYLRVLVGILLIFTVLTPLQKIMHIAPLWNEDAIFSEAGTDSNSLEKIIAEGEALSEENIGLALQNYRSNIFTLLENELANKFDKKLIQLDLIINEDPANEKFGIVEKLSAIVHENKEKEINETIKVQKVSIKIHQTDKKEELLPVNSTQTEDTESREEEGVIEKHLASFLQLSAENVKVKILQ